MKRHFLFLIPLSILLFFVTKQGKAQKCGFELAMKQELKRFPLYEKDIQKANQAWVKYATQKTQTGHRPIIDNGDTIYEIPVVIHVLNPGGAIGNKYNPVDSTLRHWIDYLNQVYSGTYPGYPQAGNGGVRLPVKFVLAKRDPNCQPTDGIVRVDLSNNSAYVTYGIAHHGSQGLSEDDIAANYQWPVKSYYNVYVTNKFDGEDGFHATSVYTTGYAYLGLSTNIPHDGAYMLAKVAKAGESTFPHEIGHALGLYHTFEGSHGNTCAPNNNCQQDGDKVCDTDPCLSALGSCPGPSDINPCTNSAYGANGVQHNFMNYSRCKNHFTPGQAERMMFMMQRYRNSLIHSLAALPPSNQSNHEPVSACVPGNISNPNNNFNMGPANVLLDSIQYFSSGLNRHENNFYVNHTTSCLHQFYTSLIQGQSYTLSVSTKGPNRQNIKVWIDYDNSGSFEPSELVMNKSKVSPGQPETVSITAPGSSVTNTPLRMRVMADYYTNHNMTPCSSLKSGQTEDFSVTILPKTAGIKDVFNSPQLKVFPNPATKILTVIAKPPLKGFSVFNISGQKVLTKKIRNSDIGENVLKYKVNITSLSRGFYIIKARTKQGTMIHQKFVKK